VMAQSFIVCDREQELLLPPSLREWLPEKHLAWFVLDAVGELDLGPFHVSYREDGWGRAAHDPAMMVAVFVYAYAIGVRSSRAIERRCHDDVAFRVICANQAPDHATIARFRVRHEAAIAGLFGEVLALCARSGLVKVGVVAVDGTKIAAAATHHATRSYEQIARRSLRRRRASTRPRTSSMARRAATSCPRGCARAVIAAGCCARPSRRWRPSAPRRPRRSRAAAASGWPSVGAGSGRTGSSSVTSSASTRLGYAAGIASDGSRRMVGARHNIKPYPLPS
jgi:transposase